MYTYFYVVVATILTAARMRLARDLVSRVSRRCGAAGQRRPWRRCGRRMGRAFCACHWGIPKSPICIHNNISHAILSYSCIYYPNTDLYVYECIDIWIPISLEICLYRCMSFRYMYVFIYILKGTCLLLSVCLFVLTCLLHAEVSVHFWCLVGCSHKRNQSMISFWQIPISSLCIPCAVMTV